MEDIVSFGFIERRSGCIDHPCANTNQFYTIFGILVKDLTFNFIIAIVSGLISFTLIFILRKRLKLPIYLSIIISVLVTFVVFFLTIYLNPIDY